MPFPSIVPALNQALSARGYAEPTPVQAAVLEHGATDHDLLVSAQTGSGKTVAYGLAMAPTLLSGQRMLPPRAEPLALIVAPTRELALQVHAELGWLYAHTGARLASCVGGMDIRQEQRTLAQGAHIVVGTPGRLRDHLERGNLDVTALRVVVLDEADEMLDLGFREDLEAILDTTPPERRTLLFSATIPPEIAGLAKRYQRDALRIATTRVGEAHGDIEYRALPIAPHETDKAVVNILRYFEARGAMIFCSTREAVRRLHGHLLERGFAVVALSGELSQAERSRAIQALRDGRARACVATDVAARGLDLPDLGLVIHADLPRTREALLHRSGRTGRAGRKGTSVLLVPHSRRRATERMLAAAGLAASWSPPPSAEQIRERDRERLAHDIEALAQEAGEEDAATARLLGNRYAPEVLAMALVRLSRSRLPEPEELADGEAGRAEAPRQRLEDTVWFRMNIGRTGNADPRWILSFLCRRGRTSRRNIGEIRIQDRETWFEVARPAAAQFQASVQLPDPEDGAIRIAAVPDGHPKPERRHRAGPPAQKGRVSVRKRMHAETGR